MKDKIFKKLALIAIIGNIVIGATYLLLNDWTTATIHISLGIIFIPAYFDLIEQKK